MEPAQTQKNKTQIDKRIVAAILRAVAERNSFVVQHRDVYGQLRVLAAGEELYELENKIHEAVSGGPLRGVYRLPGPCKDGGCGIIVVSPEPLSREALTVIEYAAALYQFYPYDGSSEKREVDQIIHNFVKMQTSSCLEVSSPAKAVYVLAKAYGLAVQEEADLDRWGVGKIVYKIEGLDRPVVKEVYYCSRCLSFPDDEQFVEKCRSWRFKVTPFFLSHL